MPKRSGFIFNGKTRIRRDVIHEQIVQTETIVTNIVEENVAKSVPVGTRMLFQQTYAPTGWIKEIDTTYEDMAIRLTVGDVVNKITGNAFTTCMTFGRTTTDTTQDGTIANATQGGTIANTTAGGSLSKTKAGGSNANTTAGGTVGNKALSEAMLAKHRHGITRPKDFNGSSAMYYLYYHADCNTGGSTNYTAYVGSGSNHNHGFTGTAHTHTFTGTEHTHTFTGTAHGHTFTGSAHSHTFTGKAHNHSVNLDIKYIDCIIAIKENPINTIEESNESES